LTLRTWIYETVGQSLNHHGRQAVARLSQQICILWTICQLESSILESQAALQVLGTTALLPENDKFQQHEHITHTSLSALIQMAILYCTAVKAIELF